MRYASKQGSITRRLARAGWAAGLMACAALGAALPAQAAISAAQRQVLIDLYNQGGGSAWNNQSGWLGAPGTECSWWGIVCNAAQDHVTEIQMHYQNLVGTMPPIAALTALESLDLEGNQLSGPIPSLAGLTNLEIFIVGGNRLTGPIPELSNLPMLSWVDLSNNQLSGPIPSLASLTQLFSFRVENNQLSGTPPALPHRLINGASALCPNLLHTPSASDFEWDFATHMLPPIGTTVPYVPWSSGCTPGYLVRASAGAGGSVGPVQQGVVSGATGTISITPDAGQVLDSYASTCGGTLTGSSLITGAVTADCTVQVSFKAPVTPSQVQPVPTLSHWALLLLSTLAAGLALLRLRGGRSV